LGESPTLRRLPGRTDQYHLTNPTTSSFGLPPKLDE
jgi:hypothetical protein